MDLTKDISGFIDLTKDDSGIEVYIFHKKVVYKKTVLSCSKIKKVKY